MSNTKWATLLEVGTRTEAEMLKEALEAQGVPVEIFQEAIHSLFPGALAKVTVCVPSDRLKEARAMLDDPGSAELEEFDEADGAGEEEDE